jgi:hypothetical protein
MTFAVSCLCHGCLDGDTYRDVPVETRVRDVNTARLAHLSQLGRR